MSLSYASEYFLVTLDDCKDYLDIDDSTDDAIIGYLMQAVSDMFKENTGRNLVEAELTEYYTGDDTDRLYLRSYPISAVASINWDWDEVYGADTLLESDNYRVDSEYGFVRIFGGSVWDRGIPIKVVYTAGYTQANMPYDLRTAALEALGVLFKRRTEGRFDTSTYSRGDVSYSYLDEMPHMVRDTMKRYRRFG
jgi:uncharacterized phiE125 gp8 family phage protein